MAKGKRLEDLEIYKLAMEIGDMISQAVVEWNAFDKWTLGQQLVRSADSIALNIAEGYGRFHYKENRNFCYYSRGSAKETATALTKAKTRNLLTADQHSLITIKLDSYFRISYKYIQSIGRSGSE